MKEITTNDVIEIKRFIRHRLAESKKDKLIIGLSGGIDSTVTLALAVSAVGYQNVLTYSLPSEISGASTERAKKISEYFGVSFEIYNISQITNAYKERDYGLMPDDYYRLGNIMARTRMTILYDKALANNGLVLNTCNLSEDLVGYATKFGDAAGDLAPIAHLTKTEIYELAELLGIPEILIERTPSAELWDGQTDEGELGFKYSELDSVITMFRDKVLPYMSYYTINKLYVWMDNYQGLKPVSDKVWDSIRTKNYNSQHKLQPMPNILK